MATITITYQGPADGQPSVSVTHVGSVPDAAVAVFFAAYRDMFGPYFDNISKTVVDAPLDGTNKPNALATDAQVFERYTQWIAERTAVQANGYAARQAAAAAAPAPVVVTQTQ